MHAARRNRGANAAFTLIELLLIVTIIGIIGASATPKLMRVLGAAEEVSTIASLRTIHNAQVVYATTCAGGEYAPSIPWLATSPTTGQPPFISADFKTNVTDRRHYRIRFTVGPLAKGSKKTCNGLGAGLAATTFFVGADLLAVTNGAVSRYFGVNQTGVVYQSTKRVAPFFTGDPPAPAVPLR